MAIINDSENLIHAEPFERTGAEKLVKINDDRRAIEMVRRFMMNSRDYREPHMELALRAREMYENWRPSGRTMINRANLRLPFGYTVIETLLPKLTDVFLSDGQVIKWEGQDSQDAQYEEVMTDFHNVQLEDMRFSPKLIASMKAMLLDGTMVAKVPYRFVEIEAKRRVQEEDPITGEIASRKEDFREVTFDGPDYEPVDIRDFYPDWSVKNPGDVQSMRGCVHRMYKTFNALKSNEKRNGQGIYENLDELQMSMSVKGASNSAAWQAPFFTDKYKDKYDRLNDNRINRKDANKIEIWEYWGLWDPKGNGEFRPYILTIANGDVLIRVQENFYNMQFKPFIACPNIPRDGEFYGIPELIAIMPLIKEANALRNARLDNVNISANPMWLVDRAAGINLKSLYSRPNGLMLTNDMNGLKPITMPDPSEGSLQESAAIQQEIQNATALVSSTPQLSQLGKTFGRSATGVGFIQSASNDRIRMKSKLISDLFLKPLAKIMMMTNKQFITEPRGVRLTNPNKPNPFVELPPEAFWSNFYFKTKSDLESGGTEAEMQKMQQAFQFAQVIEQNQPGTIKGDVFLEAIFRPLIGNRVGKFLRTDEERMQIQQQQLAAEQAANAASGARQPQAGAASATPVDFAALLGG